MAKQIANTGQRFIVEYEKRKIILKNEDGIIVKLKEDKDSKTSFKIEDKKYTIQNKGFWNPETVIKKGNKVILVLRRPLNGIVAMAEMDNGDVYKCHIENTPVAKLTFLTTGNVAVLSYSQDAKTGSKTALNFHTPILSKKDLRLLIVLGCYCFTGIIREGATQVKTTKRTRKSVVVVG